MKKYRVYFIKDGIKLAKVVFASSLLEVTGMFDKVKVVSIKEIDSLPLEDEI